MSVGFLLWTTEMDLEQVAWIEKLRRPRLLTVDKIEHCSEERGP